MIRVSNIPDPLSKVDVQAMFDKHGNVRQLTGVGENPPYTTYDVTMATDAERQKALIAFNGKPAPGQFRKKCLGIVSRENITCQEFIPLFARIYQFARK